MEGSLIGVIAGSGRSEQKKGSPVLSVGEQQPLLSADSSALRTARQCAPSPFTISSRDAAPLASPGLAAICIVPVSFVGLFTVVINRPPC